MLYQDIGPKKLAVLMGLYQEALQQFIAAPTKADAMLGLGGPAAPHEKAAAEAVAADRPHQAALVVVANALLNLDEVITKN